VTGGQLISEGLGIKFESVTLAMLGRAKRARIEKENTTIIDGAGKKSSIEACCAQIRAQIEETTSDYDYDKEKLQERLSRMPCRARPRPNARSKRELSSARRSRDRRQICRGVQDLCRQFGGASRHEHHLRNDERARDDHPNPDIDGRQHESSLGAGSGRAIGAKPEHPGATFKRRRWRGGSGPIAIWSGSSSSRRHGGSRQCAD
jgi:hypothetical protein